MELVLGVLPSKMVQICHRGITEIQVRGETEVSEGPIVLVFSGPHRPVGSLCRHAVGSVGQLCERESYISASDQYQLESTLWINTNPANEFEPVRYRASLRPCSSGAP